jgi:hypothetical protein
MLPPSMLRKWLWRRLRQIVAVIAAYILLSPAVCVATLQSMHFEPPAVGVTQTGQVTLVAIPIGTVTDVRLKAGWSANEIPLTLASDGSFRVTLNVSDMRTQQLADDVSRTVLGTLREYSGTTLLAQYNVVADMLSPDVPDVSVTALDAQTQATPHVFNMVGTYDTPLATITKDFYRYYGDDYDNVNVVFLEGRFLNRFHSGISNKIQNIGLTVFDNTAAYGSHGRLQGYTYFPSPTLFDGAGLGFVHETGHEWVNFLHYAPLNVDQPHWPISTLAPDIMGYGVPGGAGLNFDFSITQTGANSWVLHTDNGPKVYSPASLYLMGLVPSTAIGTNTIFTNNTQTQANNAVWVGPVTTFTGADIVASDGERIPNYLNSQKNFRVATILVSNGALASHDTMRLYDWLAARAELTSVTATHEGLVKFPSNPFYAATGGRATMSSALTPAPTFQPQSGLWWNPAEGGRGFMLEYNGVNLFMATFLYDASGRSNWYGAGPAPLNGSTFSTPLIAYSGGQTLTGAYKPPAPGVSPGNISIVFSDATHATLTWPGGTIPITRFEFTGNGLNSPPSATQPQTGWWWNPSEGGRGFSVEVQNNMAYIATYMYDTSGNPVWYASGPAALTAGNYQGTWSSFTGGQTLTGTFHPATGTSNAGSLTVQFSSPTAATLTLPDGRQIPIQRFGF